MDRRKIFIPDLFVAAGGLLALISMYLPWWQVLWIVGEPEVTMRTKVNGWNRASGSVHITGTVTGPLVWVPMMALTVLGILAAVRVVTGPRLMPGRGFHAVAGVAGIVGVVLVICRWQTYYQPPMPTVTANIAWGASAGTYVGLICGAAVAGAGIAGVIGQTSWRQSHELAPSIWE